MKSQIGLEIGTIPLTPQGSGKGIATEPLLPLSVPLNSGEKMKFKKLSMLFVSGLLLLDRPTKAAIVFDPVVGTGAFSLVPNGGFESGLTGWSDQRGQSQGRGSFSTGGVVAIDGHDMAWSRPNLSFTGPGFTVGTIVSVVPNATYVLSGYLYAGECTNAGYSVAIDVYDSAYTTQYAVVKAVSGDPRIQFVYSEFTVPAFQSQLYVRLLRENQVTAGQRGYYDDVAITPIALFSPPVSSIPEPSSSLALFGISGGAMIHRRRKVHVTDMKL